MSPEEKSGTGWWDPDEARRLSFSTAAPALECPRAQASAQRALTEFSTARRRSGLERALELV